MLWLNLRANKGFFLGVLPLCSIYCPRAIKGCLGLCVVRNEECGDYFLGKADLKTESIIRMNIFFVIMAVVPEQ